MPARRGRPPKPNPQAGGLPKRSQTTDAFKYLYKTDTSTVQCALCSKAVKSIPDHLREEHPTVRPEDYQEQYPSLPMEGEEDEDTRLMITVTEEEAAAHPCGRDGVLIEKSLSEAERPLFVADVQDLIRSGFEAGYEVAALAHLMTMARRVRISIEAIRAESKGQLYASDRLDLLHDLEDKIGKMRSNMEKVRSTRLKEFQEDPTTALEDELRSVEAFIQSKIGEFQEQCPGCGQMLTAPALPHWAYEQSKDERGNPYWPVWSPELWVLVKDRIIPLWQMAYILRTSPEGLRLTAQRRAEEWPSWIEIEREEQQLRTKLLADDRAYVPKDEARKGEDNGRNTT